MNLKKLSALCALICTAIFLTGASSCDEFLNDPENAITKKTDNTPRYVVTVHEIIKYKRGEMIEEELDSFFGGTVCVNRNLFLHSRDIRKIEMLPRPGNPDFYDIRITLTSRGQKIWSAMAVSRMENKKFAFVIDGMYYRTFTPPIMTEPAADDLINEKVTVTIDGPFDPATAKGLATNSERNYKIYHP